MRFRMSAMFFFFNDTATTEIYTLSLHDALPISSITRQLRIVHGDTTASAAASATPRSEEHTSELQSLRHLVCRLLLEKKNVIPPCPPRRGVDHVNVRKLGPAKMGDGILFFFFNDRAPPEISTFPLPAALPL